MRDKCNDTRSDISLLRHVATDVAEFHCEYCNEEYVYNKVREHQRCVGLLVVSDTQYQSDQQCYRNQKGRMVIRGSTLISQLRSFARQDMRNKYTVPGLWIYQRFGI